MKYEDSLQSFRGLNHWFYEPESNVLGHATSKVHRVAMTRWKADAVKASGRSAVLSSTIRHCLPMLDGETCNQARIARKFDLCFVMAKR